MALYNLATTEQEHHLAILHRVIVFPKQVVQIGTSSIVLAHLSHQNKDKTSYTSVHLIFRDNIDLDVMTSDGRKFYTGRREEEAFFFDVIGSFSYIQLFDSETGSTGRIRLSIDVQQAAIRKEIPDISAELLRHVGVAPGRTIEVDDGIYQRSSPAYTTSAGLTARHVTAGIGATSATTTTAATAATTAIPATTAYSVIPVTTTTTELAEVGLLSKVESDPELPTQQLDTPVAALKRTTSKTEIAQVQAKRSKQRLESAASVIQEKLSVGSGVRRRTRSQATTGSGRITRSQSKRKTT